VTPVMAWLGAVSAQVRLRLCHVGGVCPLVVWLGHGSATGASAPVSRTVRHALRVCRWSPVVRFGSLSLSCCGVPSQPATQGAPRAPAAGRAMCTCAAIAAPPASHGVGSVGLPALELGGRGGGGAVNGFEWGLVEVC
jgi:hypothetical protein